MQFKKPVGFDKRLQHSIELLQKAEKLALRYDATDGFFLAFSGGKDSQALYHVAVMGGVKFKAHMNFTSVDPPQVIRFVRQQYPDVVTHAPEKSIYQFAVEYGILPSMRIRWCCQELKEQAGAGKVTLIGIRKQESARRAKRHEVEVSSKKFSGNLEQFYNWQKEQIEKKEEKLLRKMKREGKKVNEDFFSADKENEVRCINGKDSILISPIFEWSEADVWYFLNEVVKVPHCELYDQGYKRIGCILCPMSSNKQKLKEMKEFPYVKRGWIKAIKAIRNGGGIKENVLSEQCRTGNGNATYPQKPQEDCGRVHLVEHSRTRDSEERQRNAQELGKRYSKEQWNRMFENYPPITGTEKKTEGFGLDSAPRSKSLDGFSDSPSDSGASEGQNIEPTEDEIAEKIFSWWISGKSYERWYAETYLQQKIKFED